MSSNKWPAEEEMLLRLVWPRMGIACVHLFPHRSPAAVEIKASRMGLCRLRVDQLIMMELVSHPEGMTTAELAKATGFHRGSITNAVLSMRLEGRLKRLDGKLGKAGPNTRYVRGGSASEKRSPRKAAAPKRERKPVAANQDVVAAAFQHRTALESAWMMACSGPSSGG